MIIVDSTVFVAGFTIIHTIAYTVAGMIELQFADYIYGEEERRVDFVRDMTIPEESRRIGLVFLPAQLVRGVLMAIVLLPLLNAMGELTYVIRVTFLAGLMFVYADLASAVPFPNTIEGLVYLEKEYISRDAFLTIQFEAVMYSLLFGLTAGWILF
ncbi:hypothetical protein G9464_16900 [Halostella sp. JP-L12]|uniref:hypothetical protein n=1 Tax=Halostella TaxID=1843185 RepID=UPI000EF7625F|nr:MULTISPECIES: hypothetical protein [Halostella]NHN49257.1 hypothetical protein [Halostella sp. JP-L12]